MEVKFYDIGSVDDSLFMYAVIVSEYDGKWIYCKHSERDTWEIPGGRRDSGEDILDTAKRELFEETGDPISYLLYRSCVRQTNTSQQRERNRQKGT